MKRCLIIAALLLALMFPGLSQADLINVTCDGVAGNLVCRDVSGNIIYTVDATNRKLSIPSGSAIDVESGGYFKIAGTAVTATAAKLNMIPADGGAGEYLTTDGAGTWSWGAGTSGSLDDAYNSGAAITVDGSAVTLNASHGTNDAFFVNKTAGTGDAIQITNAGTGYDIAGTSGTWYVTKAGVASFASFSPLTAGLTITGGTVNLNASSNNATNINTGTSTGTVTIGGGSGSVAVNSSSWDIATTGAVTGISTIGMSGDLTLSAGDVYLANGKALKGSSTTAETLKIQAYDVDNTTYRDALTLTNGNTIAIAVGSGSETVAINSADWDIGATGDMTGVGAITMDGALTVSNATVTLYNNEAITLGHATNSGADDLTISLTGATDSSIILSSAGTGEDAVSVQSSAGGVDVDAAAAKDVNIAGGQVALVSKDDAASAISLTANIGVSETIVVTNTQGTGEGAITLTATAGGVDVDAAAAKDVNIAGGQVLISSKDNAASAIALTANTGANETIVVTNTQGTNAAASALTATAGGITRTSGGAVAISATSGITTGDAITGDGTAALGGFLKTVTDDADGEAAIGVAESGSVQTNAGAAGAAAWVLPDAAAGLNYTFIVMAAQEMQVTPAAGDKICIAGVCGDAAEYWSADAVGESLTLVAVDGTNWVATSYTGTWTQETP